MKKAFFLVALACTILVFIGCNKKRSGTPRVLVFYKTAGYHHASIAAGKLAVLKLGQENGFDVDTTADAAYFNEDSLAKYAAVIFLSTTGNVLDHYQEAAFERYIQSGGGYVGIHAATDTEYDWGWYGRLVGAYFSSHPRQQEAKLLVTDQTNAATKHLPKEWVRKDEWYNYKNISDEIKVLMTLDETSYEGGTNKEYHPITWYHEYDGGRAFYTGLGHTDESYSEENFLKLLLGGIQYAIAGNYELNYSKAKTLLAPDEDRFTKVNLVQATFFEPTEMTVLPNLDILVAQRRGELMLYNNEDGSIKQVGLLDVYHKADVPGVNAEEGFMGLKADPDYANNHFIYAYYSPKDTSVNRLSRFKFENGQLDMASEKVVLEVASQRQICCHTGGSIDFAGDGKTLFLSTGDNSTPFNERGQPYVNNGFAPLNDAPGHEQYDARRSSGNTNDLRGKILRIKINKDGSYEIPEGNLFPPGTPNTRPEIYVMGNRNPYRIMVDKKKGDLYWGEVGPDARADSIDTRGPKGYDEVNQAKEAGFYGWPLFVANNKPYHEYDYTTGTSGPAFDPAKPVNNSKNNTGLKELPPAKPAFIWYPYEASREFPQVGTGGRNAMAGPVYYTDMYPKETRLPDYYNGKLFIYEWIRGWIKVVTMRPNGDFDKMEPFMEHVKLANLIDMEVGPDGKLYLLEYGTGWFRKNEDAGLSRIDYNAGNRAPKITADLQVDKTSGTLPFSITATVEANDPEKDKLTYIWNLGNNEIKETTEPTLQYTYSQPGDYAITVEVADDKKASVKSNTITIYAGNAAPVVHIALMGNQTFYFPGKPVQYAVHIEDKDDTAQQKDLSNLVVSADYVEGSDQAAASPGHQVLTEAMMGKNLMLTLDCKTCHNIDEKNIGPSFTEVAKRYEKDPNAVSYLSGKIINGGGGVWGEVPMAAHPGLSQADARQIVAWIQSLTAANTKKSLPASGAVQPTLNQPVQDRGILYLSASYTDKGGNGIKPLTGNAMVTLRNNKMSFNGVTEMTGFTSFDRAGTRSMITPKTTGWFKIPSIDLSGISKAVLNVAWRDPSEFGYTFEVHLDAPDGKKLGEFTLKPGLAKPDNGPVASTTLSSRLEAVTDGKLHNVYIVSKPNNAAEPNSVILTWIEWK